MVEAMVAAASAQIILEVTEVPVAFQILPMPEVPVVLVREVQAPMALVVEVGVLTEPRDSMGA